MQNLWQVSYGNLNVDVAMLQKTSKRLAFFMHCTWIFIFTQSLSFVAPVASFQAGASEAKEAKRRSGWRFGLPVVLAVVAI